MSETTPTGLPPQGTVDTGLQNALLVGGGVALVALVAFLGFDPCLFCGPPEREVIKVSIDKDCVGRIDSKKTAEQKDRDVLVWRIESECPKAQNVLMCVSSENGAPLPLRCWGDPETAVLDKPFEIEGATSREVSNYIICALKWPPAGGKYDYDVEFLTGDSSTTLICPTNRDYELALEVVP